MGVCNKKAWICVSYYLPIVRVLLILINGTVGRVRTILSIQLEKVMIA